MMRLNEFCVSAILFVYDVTNEESFKNVEDWMMVAKQTLSSSVSNSDIKKESSTTSNDNDSSSTRASGDSPSQKGPGQSPTFAAKVHFALVGNKTDLQHMVAVKPQVHEDFAATNAMSSHLVSASRADGVELMIKKVRSLLTLMWFSFLLSNEMRSQL